MGRTGRKFHDCGKASPGFTCCAAGAMALLLATNGACAYTQTTAPASQMAAPAPQPSTASATDIVGTWQGTLHIPKTDQHPQIDLRLIFKISRTDAGALKAVWYSIDQGGQPSPIATVNFQGGVLKFTVTVVPRSYQGKMSEDGKTIAGTWMEDTTPIALPLERATPETAWDIPPPPPPPKLLPADADPSFSVATIKPNPSGATSMQRLTTNGHDFTVRNASLGDLISFAYNVQMKQVLGAPSWVDEDRYDVDARQDQDGLANDKQLRSMARKLIEDRFQLKVHRDKRELPAFVLSVGKDGQKLTPTEVKGPLPGMGFRPAPGGLKLQINNGTLDDLTDFLQSAVLDRPVVNQTGIPGRFDIGVTFMPDDSQFKGHPPKLPAETDTTDTAPNLFEAVQQQLGLKLAAEKAAVDVIIIDHVEKPSPN